MERINVGLVGHKFRVLSPFYAAILDWYESAL